VPAHLLPPLRQHAAAQGGHAPPSTCACVPAGFGGHAHGWVWADDAVAIIALSLFAPIHAAHATVPAGTGSICMNGWQRQRHGMECEQQAVRAAGFVSNQGGHQARYLCDWKQRQHLHGSCLPRT
jgi:hypothetical protein